jgi:hypothetical protein
VQGPLTFPATFAPSNTILPARSRSRSLDSVEGAEAKMLWVDKYRPKSLDQVMVHQDIAQNLKKLVP